MTLAVDVFFVAAAADLVPWGIFWCACIVGGLGHNTNTYNILQFCFCCLYL